MITTRGMGEGSGFLASSGFGSPRGSAPPPPPPPEDVDLWGWWTRDPKIGWVWTLGVIARARSDEEVILCG